MDTEGMNFLSQDITECLINEAVAGDEILAGELGGDDGDIEVAATRFARSGVAGVFGAFVEDFEPHRREAGAQPLFDLGHA